MAEACSTKDNDNSKESKGASTTVYSTATSETASESEFEDEYSDVNENLYKFIQRMQSDGNGNDGSVLVEVPGKINPKYFSKRCIQNAEVAKLIPVPPTYQKIVTTTDPDMMDGYVILTKNRASKIFYAIAAAVFHTSDSLLANQAKLLYLKQIEKDYNAAKKRKDNKEIRRCIKLVNKTVSEYDEPWFDEEWLIASKAFFAPIHILYHCPRVPSNVHVVRYQFSPVLDDEPTIKIVVDNGDYVISEDDQPKPKNIKKNAKFRKR